MTIPSHFGLALFPPRGVAGTARLSGFRLGEMGTHTSRTMMLAELETLLADVPAGAVRGGYQSAVVEENCLGKATAATRRQSFQRLSELYAFDPAVAVFRVLRRLWDLDPAARPLLALLCAVARDPLLATLAPPVVALAPGEEMRRDGLRAALHAVVGTRMNDAVLDKVMRNAASSFTQSGHFDGRTFKIRRKVAAPPAAVAYALFLATAAGFRGGEALGSGWMALLDIPASQAIDRALEAKRAGLLDLSIGNVVEIDFLRLDPVSARLFAGGQ
jgi:hypothetical protein